MRAGLTAIGLAAAAWLLGSCGPLPRPFAADDKTLTSLQALAVSLAMIWHKLPKLCSATLS